MFEHHVDSIKDLFRRIAGNPLQTPEPQIGMTWYIVQNRAHPHYARGYRDGLALLQIVGLDDEKIEFLHNSRLTSIPRADWDNFYEQNLRRARSAAGRLGGGSIVPEYRGIQPVHESYVERLRNPRPRPFCY